MKMKYMPFKLTGDMYMKKQYFNQTSLSDAYLALTRNNISYAREIFTLLLLKQSGLNTHEFVDFSTPHNKSRLLEAAQKLSYLYTSEDETDKKQKYNFINPLEMKSWGTNPTESIHSWSTNRIMNNVTGGPRYWKNIVITEDGSVNSIKLKRSYMDHFSNMENKIPIDAISVWYSRFLPFDREVTVSELINHFIEDFKITEEEKSRLFSYSSTVSLKYSETPISSSYIRSLIYTTGDKVPEGWSLPNTEKEKNSIGERPSIWDSSITKFQKRGTYMSLDHYKNILDTAQQIILMGPPGTSKSYLAQQIAKDFNVVKRLQFHPQYSYQDFIGGKILEQGTLKDNKGVLISLLEEAMVNENIDYLLIIEEINRANVSQVFGEMIQLLDRDETLVLTFNNEEKEYYLPRNLKIVGTMNTTDRTVGRIDYALKRRFSQIYCAPDYSVLTDKVRIENNEFSISEFLRRINSNLVSTLSHKEMVLGHALFLKDYAFESISEQYIWNISDLFNLFQYVIRPIIEDYCNGNEELIENVIGEGLYNSIEENDFLENIRGFLN